MSCGWKLRKKRHDDLVKDIVLAISPRYGIFWNNETGKGHSLDGSFVSYGLKGSGDILGCLRGGRFVSIEVKTGRGVQRESQIYFERAIKGVGGLYMVGRSVEQVKMELEAACRN